MAEQCAATNSKPLYLAGEAPSFYNWTSAVGFAKGKDGLRSRGFPAKGSAYGPVCTLTSESYFVDYFSRENWTGFLSDPFDFFPLFNGQPRAFLKE